jgi:hypothetical protein
MTWPNIRPHIAICLDGLMTTRNHSVILVSAPAEVGTEELYQKRSRMNKPVRFIDVNRQVKLQSASGSPRLPTPTRGPFTIQTAISNDKSSTGTLNFTDKANMVERSVSIRYVYSSLHFLLRDE